MFMCINLYVYLHITCIYVRKYIYMEKEREFRSGHNSLGRVIQEALRISLLCDIIA